METSRYQKGLTSFKWGYNMRLRSSEYVCHTCQHKVHRLFDLDTEEVLDEVEVCTECDCGESMKRRPVCGSIQRRFGWSTEDKGWGKNFKEANKLRREQWKNEKRESGAEQARRQQEIDKLEGRK